ncbi:DNA-directed RNA polymerase I subunit RPA12 [Onthophagus taurus]|uniref:DNA-directed RNA polymerase I subunit RPA12 n=1 Tax=Onthophagus taurus TaxID=166361 RepID=UPI000C203EF9|nr:DNA-directed RNA polymerase I subunit RPA12-like isoform X3 [Onthophagus taurus]
MSKQQSHEITPIFICKPGFCPDCGTILPPVSDKGDVKCYLCGQEMPIEVFKDSKVQYTIHFNSVEALTKNHDEKMRQKQVENADEGPIVDRKCVKCGNDKMSYATLQLRSADEGQTVFYTCTKCKHKESENS